MTPDHLPESDDLMRRRTLPAGGQSLYVMMRDGWPVRLVHWPRRDPAPGSILLVTGRADFVEKYAETLHDLVDTGWGVTCFDWRGQGLSRRVGRTAQHGASPGFGVWLDDLAQLVAWARERADGPLFAMAHSMGGHLLLRYLAGGGQGLARVALLAPMLRLAAKPLGPGLARRVARLMVALGRGGDYVWGGGPWEAGKPGEQRQIWLTSDVERYRDESWWIGQYPALALGSVTWGWLDEAFASIDALQAKGVPEAVATPVLALIPDRDGLVDSAATRQLLPRLPNAALAEFPGAGHELLREAPAVRSDVLARILAFFEATA